MHCNSNYDPDQPNPPGERKALNIYIIEVDKYCNTVGVRSLANVQHNNNNVLIRHFYIQIQIVTIKALKIYVIGIDKYFNMYR